MRAALRIAGFVATLVLSGAAVAQPADPATAPPKDTGVPVTFDGETLYTVHEFMGMLTPEERAKVTERRLHELAEDPFYSETRYATDEFRGTTRLLYGDTTLGLVTDEDAALAGLTRDELAARRLHAITAAIERYRIRQLPRARMKAAVEALVATAVLALVLFGLRRLFLWAARRVDATRGSDLARWLESRLRLSTDRVVALERRALDVLRIAATVVVVLIYLQAVFTIVPPTRGYALSVLRYVLAPVGNLWRGFVRNVGNLITIVVLVTLARYAIKGLRYVLREVADGRLSIPGISQEWAVPLYKLIRLVLIALAAVMIYPYIPGSDTAAFKGLGLFAGALFTLGASGTVGNFVGGLVAIFVGAFRIGDVIRIGDVTGVVVDMTLVLTRIRTFKEEIVTVPNTSIITGQIVNYSTQARADGVILHTSVTIGYDAPWRTVHELLLRAADRTASVEKHPAPFVLQDALDDFYVRYQLNARTRRPEIMPAVYAELHQNIQDAFNEGGVEIMSPHYASLRDGNTVTIPERQRPEGYAARPFGVRVERDGGGGSAPR